MITWRPLVSQRQPSRVENYYALAPAFVPSNVNDDHGRRGRKDYSVLLLAPDMVSLAPTVGAAQRRFEQRASGVRSSASTVWKARSVGSASSNVETFALLRSGVLSSRDAYWAPRITKIADSQTIEWALRRAGEATS
jgi:hypothetical protein